MEAIIFLGLCAATWLFTQGAKPIQFIKKLLDIHTDSTPKSLFLQTIKALVNCSLCSGFWFGLSYYVAIYHDHWFLMACLTSIGSELFTRITNFLFNKVFNHL